jgi:histidyl-tRNA synthetase
MSHKLQPVRGTHDILPDEFEKFHAVVTRARALATLYGFREMATPIFESADIFSRSMGETSDVVSKEMFTFQTKGEESVTLRPEFTAGIVRAFLSNGMQQHLPLKLFSTGPVFRYERPQKGRQRQFHQVNFEWLGDDSPKADVEAICLAGLLLHSLTEAKDCTLLINTLGDKESRATYRTALINYLLPYAKELSEDSQRRLIVNPLRILDSKNEQDKKILEGAPHIAHYLNDNARKRFNTVCEALSQKGMPFFQAVKITPSLVRGLDYYTDTVFEFVAETGELGAQNTVLAGGRYDGLVEQMGGKSTPAIGFAAGVERLLLLTQDIKYAALEKPKDLKIMILPFEGQESTEVHLIAELLRMTIVTFLHQYPTERKCIVEILWEGTQKKRMERADKRNASHVMILSPEKMKRNAFDIKDMITGVQPQEATMDMFRPQNPDKFKNINALFNIIEHDLRLRKND